MRRLHGMWFFIPIIEKENDKWVFHVEKDSGQDEHKELAVPLLDFK